MTKMEISGGVARIELCDGKVNAMSPALMGEIARGLDLAETASALVILTGQPGIFSAGFDLGTFRKGREATLEMLRAGAGLIERLLAFPRPVLVGCTGHAYPMGAFLMLASDVRIAVSGPFKIGMNEVAIGLTVPRFALEIARHRLSPPGFARITSAAMFGPDEACALGYADRVVASEELDAALREEASRLAKLDPTAYAATKARVNERVLAAVRAAIAEELR
jgi:enoyl-CoA hydratase/carnithine racemase